MFNFTFITNIKNKKYSLIYSLSIIVIISFITTIFSKQVENFAPFHKKYCEKNKLCPTYPILFIRFVHYFVTFYACLYYFIFNTRYDLYYLCLYSIVILHWVFINDCILSSWEMSYYSGKQKLGETPLLNPYLRVFAGNLTDYIILFQGIIMTINFILVINRFNYKYYNYLFGATILILQSYLMLKDRII
jgi:hypothetical protein